ncbi:MAG: tRNA uridine-5-carboxymethylaminomethyl(34) synthesis GTPase MnmE [Desulfovibrio sp.]|jgi:tRNA modification GTPase|nr:tRNA uridine-5-carboxymethylaminomethyl(34) synthesis GTPase MnmE [Desulfovibrio sp.]
MPTIAAIATPPGTGGIGIARLSGPQAKEILARMFLPFSAHFENFHPWMLYRGRVLDENGEPLDDALAVFMPGPRTYTGEDTAEIHCHGGPLIVRGVLGKMLSLGARAAERGEFSRRAFVNGRMDLSQAEAVAEMIAAPSREALRYGFNRLDGLLGRRVTALREDLDNLRAQVCLAVDFPEEDVECLAREDFAAAVEAVMETVRTLLAGEKRAALMQRGAVVVLAGAVNAGKSSLLNALLGRNRALVSEYPGTTRDFLEEPCDLDGLPVRLTDTAGLRETAEPMENLGVAAGRERVRGADVVVIVLDGGNLGEAGAKAEICPDPAARQTLELAPGKLVLYAWNKCDVCMPSIFPPPWTAGHPCCAVSALTGERLEEFARVLRTLTLGGEPKSAPDGVAPNLRQAAALKEALAELRELREDIEAGQTYDCCAARLDAAAARLGEVTGATGSAEVLDRVFKNFCIGK